MSAIHDEDRPPWRMTVPRTAKRVDLDSPAPEISPERVAALRAAREREGLPEEIDGPLLGIARDLADFRAEDLRKLPTPRELEEQARQIRLSALQLRTLLRSCDTGVFLSLDLALFFERIGLEDDGSGLLGRRVSSVGAVLAALEDAAAQVEKERASVPSSRAPVVPSLAGFVASLAHHLVPYGVIGAEGGPFGRLCAAVFSAGYPGGSHVGALRYFVKEMRDDMASRGLVLSPKIPAFLGTDVCLEPSRASGEESARKCKTESSE